jgi:hypothetical protein
MAVNLQLIRERFSVFVFSFTKPVSILQLVFDGGGFIEICPAYFVLKVAFKAVKFFKQTVAQETLKLVVVDSSRNLKMD